MKRKLKIKPIYECRCDGRLQTKRFTLLSHTGLDVELEHLCSARYFILLWIKKVRAKTVFAPGSPKKWEFRTFDSFEIQWENRWKKSEKKENEIEGLLWLHGHVGQTDAAWRCCLGAPNTSPVARKSWSSPVFRRVVTGAGLRRCIGPAAFQVCLHALDYIFCSVRPLHTATHGWWENGYYSLSSTTVCHFLNI